MFKGFEMFEGLLSPRKVYIEPVEGSDEDVYWNPIF